MSLVTCLCMRMLSTCMYMYMIITCVPCALRDRVRSPGAGVTSSCEPLEVGARNLTQVLWNVATNALNLRFLGPQVNQWCISRLTSVVSDNGLQLLILLPLLHACWRYRHRPHLVLCGTVDGSAAPTQKATEILCFLHC